MRMLCHLGILGPLPLGYGVGLIPRNLLVVLNLVALMQCHLKSNCRSKILPLSGITLQESWGPKIQLFLCKPSINLP